MSFCELHSAKYKGRSGAVGCVVDGGVYKSFECEKAAVPIFCSFHSPSVAINRKHAGTIGRTISIGGVPISPGDIICADNDGVLVVPKACERVGLPADAVRLSDDAVRRLVRLRSAASGVRYLQAAVEQLVHEAVLLKAGLEDIVPCQFVRGPLPWQNGRVQLEDVHVDVRHHVSEGTPPEHMYT